MEVLVGLLAGEPLHLEVALHQIFKQLVLISFLLNTVMITRQRILFSDQLMTMKCVPVYQIVMETILLMLVLILAKEILVGHSFVMSMVPQPLPVSSHGDQNAQELVIREYMDEFILISHGFKIK